MVDDPTGSPVNKKVSVFNLFGNLNHTTNTGDASGRTLVSSTLTVGNDGTTGTTPNTVALSAVANFNKTGGERTITNLFGAKLTANLSGADANVTGIIAGSVVTDVEATLTASAPAVLIDSSTGPTLVSEVIDSAIAPFTQLTALYDSADGTIFRARLDEKVNEYQALTATQLQGFYRNVDEIITVKSFTFDDSGLGNGLGGLGDSAGAARPDFSLDLETMDNEQFDSSFNS